jgi:hypothetical protein
MDGCGQESASGSDSRSPPYLFSFYLDDKCLVISVTVRLHPLLSVTGVKSPPIRYKVDLAFSRATLSAAPGQSETLPIYRAFFDQSRMPRAIC